MVWISACDFSIYGGKDDELVSMDVRLKRRRNACSPRAVRTGSGADCPSPSVYCSFKLCYSRAARGFPGTGESASRILEVPPYRTKLRLPWELIQHAGGLVSAHLSGITPFRRHNPAGGSGTSAAPEPKPSGGGTQSPGQDDADGQKQYTTDEYLAELQKAEEARDSGDMATYRTMTARLNKALNEGRVK